MGGTTQDDSVNEDELNSGGGAWDGHGLCVCVCVCVCVCACKYQCVRWSQLLFTTTTHNYNQISTCKQVCTCILLLPDTCPPSPG